MTWADCEEYLTLFGLDYQNSGCVVCRRITGNGDRCGGFEIMMLDSAADIGRSFAGTAVDWRACERKAVACDSLFGRTSPK